MLTVDVPPEPEDGAVVLDRHADAWQRRGTWWVSATSAQNEQPWGHLLVDYGPLAPMIAESAIGEDGEDAPFEFECPCGVPHGPEGGIAEPALLARYAEAVVADRDAPLTWTEGDPEPESVTKVVDGGGEAWERDPLDSPEARWRCTTDFGLAGRRWAALVSERHPLTEATPAPSSPETPDVATPAAGPLETAFLRHVAGGPTVVSRRAVRDEPQA